MTNRTQHGNTDNRLNKTLHVTVMEKDAEQDKEMPAMASSKVYYYTTLPNGAYDNDIDDGGEVYEESEDGIMYTPRRPASVLQQQQSDSGE